MARLDQRRYGQPRTEAERAVRHEAEYGTTELPPRGTGLDNPGSAEGGWGLVLLILGGLWLLSRRAK